MDLSELCHTDQISDLTEDETKVVTPFLVKHISDQNMAPATVDNFHNFCYRHNPEITCNKRADEDKMKRIQEQLELLPNRDKKAISHVWLIFSAAPAPQRKLILLGLLSQCCFPQLSFISQGFNHLSGSISFPLFPRKSLLKSYATLISSCCVMQLLFVANGNNWQITIVFGITCVSSTLIVNVQTVDGVSLCILKKRLSRPTRLT